MKYLKLYENFNSYEQVIQDVWGVDPYEIVDLCLSTMDEISLYAKVRLDFGLVINRIQKRFNGSEWKQIIWNSVFSLESDNITKYDSVDIDSLLNVDNQKGIEIVISGLGNTDSDDKIVQEFDKKIIDRLKSYGLDFKLIDSDYSGTDTSYLTIYLNNI